MYLVSCNHLQDHRIAHLYHVPSFLSLRSLSVTLTLSFPSSLFLHLFFFLHYFSTGDDILKMKPKLIKHILQEQKCKHIFKACCCMVRARCAGMPVVEGGYFWFCSECWDASVSETCPTFPDRYDKHLVPSPWGFFFSASLKVSWLWY